MSVTPLTPTVAATGSCGYCGYALNLSSSARDTEGIETKYRKQIRKGVIAFVAVDESRFTLAHELTCTLLLLRLLLGPLQEAVAPALPKVRGHIGSAYGEEEDARDADSSSLFGGDGSSDDTRPSSGSGRRSSVASSQKRCRVGVPCSSSLDEFEFGVTWDGDGLLEDEVEQGKIFLGVSRLFRGSVVTSAEVR